MIAANGGTLTIADLALRYKQRLRVEQCWRQLETGLRVRPVVPWRAIADPGRVTTSVLALLLERVAEIRPRSNTT